MAQSHVGLCYAEAHKCPRAPMCSVRQRIRVKINLSCESSRARWADVCQTGHRNLGLDFVTIENARQTQQGSRRARWATCRGISNAIAILAKISRSQRNILQHRGSHCFTYLVELDWHLASVLAHRSLIPSRVDGPQHEKVVSWLSQTEGKAASHWEPIPAESQPL
jgi:hypothetical protein